MEPKRSRLVVCAPEPSHAREFPDVAVFSGGRADASQAERLARAVGRVLADRGVTGGAPVRLTMANCADGPTLVQINLQVGDTPLRAQAATAGIDNLRPALIRLDRQIVRASAQWCPRPWPDRPRRRLTTPAEALVTRRKPVVLGAQPRCRRLPLWTPWTTTCICSPTPRRGGRCALSGWTVGAAAGPPAPRISPRMVTLSRPSRPPVPLIVNSRPTPVLTQAAAVDRAREHGLPFLFFTDQATGRGQLLYSRYDGNLGLITPTGDGVADGLELPGSRRASPQSAREVVELDRDEAMRLLALSVDHGRVVFTRAALPAIRPVNHLVVDGRVIGRTRLTAKVSVAVRSSADAGVGRGYQANDLMRGVGRGGVWW